jgi:hypothetical protein
MRRSLLLATLLPLAACVDGGLETADPAALYEGSPEAIGVLRFLNGPAADVATLDVAAALDARAARNIVAHVRGADGVLGTGDDHLLASVAELDAIAYVGPAAIDALVAYVDSIGGVPRLELEGVLLTDAEAAALLAAANGATELELDDDAGLDARAARNLVAARPLADLAAVGAVPYVGTSAIDRLRRWAPGWSGPPGCDPLLMQELRECVETEVMEQMVGKIDAVAACVSRPEYATCVTRLESEYANLCATGGDCAEISLDLECRGVPYDGSSVLGACVSLDPIPGEGEPCSATAGCAAGTVCAGLTVWDSGNCVPAWMASTFAADLPVEISAGAGATVASSTVVRGLASVPVDIEVEVDVAGADLGRLRLELTDPNGTTSVLWDGATMNGLPPARMLPGNGISRDEAVNGLWTVTATTVGAGTAGTLDGWRLHLTSRWD